MLIMNILHRLLPLLLLLIPWFAHAQEVVIVDTLKAAYKEDTRSVMRSINRLESSAAVVQRVLSPMGEGDPIRWSQGLPGVTTGADGSSAIYVHGGNVGNNLFSIDGVPVYGYSHIFGITTAIPSNVIQSASLAKGGFDGRYGNFTASHLNIVTRDPKDDIFHVDGFLNNFLIGTSVETPIKDDMAISASVRFSPIGLEYNIINKLFPDMLASFQDFNASVGDIYAKFKWNIDSSSSLTASTLLSLDQYGFTTGEESKDAIGWNNEIVIITYRRDLGRTEIDANAYVNRYGSMQRQEKNFHGADNILSLNSSMLEAAISADFSTVLPSNWELDYGFKARYGMFAMGPTSSLSGKGVILSSFYTQATRTIHKKLIIRAVLRENCYLNNSDGMSNFSPDLSFSFKWKITKPFAVEGSIDYLHQYYHTLEGLPVGWSTDVIVPSGRTAPAEIAYQGNLGFCLSLERHSVSLGGYYKQMDNLVYYKYAKSLFTDASAAWEHSVNIGSGDSYGGEFLYEYTNKDFYFRTSYTLSKTSREGFESICGGERFNARFDRRHMLNFQGQWKGFNIAMTLQSGHWENGTPMIYQIHVPGLETDAEFYDGVNNYHMPSVFRLDLGYGRSFQSKKAEHRFNIGICNATNHFNPFMLYFEPDTESWKMLALLPILPNFSYKISF